MEYGQVPLYGDGDGHEDAGGEEDVVEGVEEVGEEVVVYLGYKTTDGGSVCCSLLKSPPDTLGDANNKEEEIKHCESNQEVVKVALESFVTEDTDGEYVGTHTHGGQHDSTVTTHPQVYIFQLFQHLHIFFRTLQSYLSNIVTIHGYHYLTIPLATLVKHTPHMCVTASNNIVFLLTEYCSILASWSLVLVTA